MDVGVVSKGVERVVEYQGLVHEGALVHQAASLDDLHLFKVQHKDTIKDVVGNRTLASEDHDLLLSDLVGETHVGGHPQTLVLGRQLQLLPHVPLDVIDFDCVYNHLLVYSATDGKEILVFEGAQGHA